MNKDVAEHQVGIRELGLLILTLPQAVCITKDINSPLLEKAKSTFCETCLSFKYLGFNKWKQKV